MLLISVTPCVGVDAMTLDTSEGSFITRHFTPDANGNAICYGPYRDGQHPGEGSPSSEQLLEDLKIMVRHWNMMRVYGSSEFAEELLELIKNNHLDMKVVVGAWIGPESEEDNKVEVEKAIQLANNYPGLVPAVCVSNETQVYWSGNKYQLDKLIDYVRYVRENVTVPVTASDDFGYWITPESKKLAREIDFIMTHVHPLWNGIQLDDSMKWVIEQMNTIESIHPGKALVIGETGWATTSHDQGEQAKLIKGKPGEKEQSEFYKTVYQWAEKTKNIVFYFEAFDENWKGGPHPNEVEKHWGFYNADRSAKATFNKSQVN